MGGTAHTVIHNWRLKLLALALSVFLWALVQSEPLSQETFSDVPVRVEIADTAWTLARAPSPATVELRLGGPAREIIRLAREGTALRIPVRTVGSSDTLIALQREWVELGQRSGVSVESVSPSALEVSFEPAVSKSLPLALRVQGQLPAELALSSELDMNPEVVRVRGPESRLSGIDSLPLVPFDLGRVRESGILTLAVDTAGLGGATVVPPDAVVAVRVEPLQERVVEGLVVQVDAEAGAPRVTVEPATVRLRLTGARTVVTSMDLSLVRISIAPGSLRGLEEGEARRVRLEVEGVPPLVIAYPSTEVVTVRPATGEEDAADPSAP